MNFEQIAVILSIVYLFRILHLFSLVCCSFIVYLFIHCSFIVIIFILKSATRADFFSPNRLHKSAKKPSFQCAVTVPLCTCQSCQFLFLCELIERLLAVRCSVVKFMTKPENGSSL